MCSKKCKNYNTYKRVKPLNFEKRWKDNRRNSEKCLTYWKDNVYEHLLTKKDEQALLAFERKIFRRIYGPKYENGERKSRTNRELEEMSKG